MENSPDKSDKESFDKESEHSPNSLTTIKKRKHLNKHTIMNLSLYTDIKNRLNVYKDEKIILPPTPLVIKLTYIISWVKHHYHKDPKTNDPYLQIRE